MVHLVVLWLFQEMSPAHLSSILLGYPVKKAKALLWNAYLVPFFGLYRRKETMSAWKKSILLTCSLILSFIILFASDSYASPSLFYS